MEANSLALIFAALIAFNRFMTSVSTLKESSLLNTRPARRLVKKGEVTDANYQGHYQYGVSHVFEWTRLQVNLAGHVERVPDQRCLLIQWPLAREWRYGMAFRRSRTRVANKRAAVRSFEKFGKLVSASY